MQCLQEYKLCIACFLKQYKILCPLVIHSVASYFSAELQLLSFGACKGNSQIPIFWVCNSCDTLQFLWLCVIVHLKSRTELQHLLITQYMLHIVYPYHVIPFSSSVPCYCHPIPSPSHFTYYFQYFLYFIFSPYLSSMIHCWLLCTLVLTSPPLLGESLEFSLWIPLQGMHPSAVLYLSNILWIPLARIWALCVIMRLPLQCHKAFYLFAHAASWSYNDLGLTPTVRL